MIRTKNTGILKAVEPSLIVTIPLFLIFYLGTKSLLFSSVIFIFLSLLLIFWEIKSTKLGYKRHCEIIESEAFKKLISQGFEIYKVNEYVGIRGMHKNYFFDVYYNWLALTNGKNYRALVLNTYFESKELDFQILFKRLSKKYSISIWSFKPYLFRWSDGSVMMNNTVALKNPKYEFIIERMDLLIEILRKENLQPIGKEKIIEAIERNKIEFIPEIQIHYCKNSR
jgi:hypothetical protein